MKIVVIADEAGWKEWNTKTIPSSVEVVQAENIEELAQHPDAEACFDLLFAPSLERIEMHRSIFPAPVFANAVANTGKELQALAGNPDQWNTIRINAWPGFFRRELLEMTQTNIAYQPVLETLGWKYETVPDIPGFITARVVSMIINEAWFTLEEKVSSKDEIDTAMKLGTNYPYGPFEWGEKIGLKKIYDLLNTLAAINPRYQPCNLLSQQAITA